MSISIPTIVAILSLCQLVLVTTDNYVTRCVIGRYIPDDRDIISDLRDDTIADEGQRLSRSYNVREDRDVSILRDRRSERRFLTRQKICISR